jgi:predicted phosphodiesterase
MTVLFAGDTHGDQRWLGRIAEKVRPAALVHLGDIELFQPPEVALADVLAHTRFLWVPGNHDFDSLEIYDRLMSPFLADGALHAQIKVVDGVRIAGLGGWFQSRVWRPPGKPLRYREWQRHIRSNKAHLRLRAARERGAIWIDEFERLQTQRADVLVCHEAPSCHRYGFEVIDDLARAMGVGRIFHGHHHQTYHHEIAGGIQVFGVGLRAVVDIDGNVLHRGGRVAP